MDLNSIYAKNAFILSEYYLELNHDSEKATQLRKIGMELTEAIDNVLWNYEDGIWYDFDLINKQSRKYFTPSNLMPLWTETFNLNSQNEKNIHTEQAVKYILQQNLDDYPGGVPTTLINR